MTTAKPSKRAGARSSKPAPADPPRIVAGTGNPAVAANVRGSSGPSVALGADCTARHAAALRIALLAKLETSAEVHLEAADVERIDTTCLQLLAAFVRERARQGRLVTWRGHSEVFGQAVGLLGLMAALGVQA